MGSYRTLLALGSLLGRLIRSAKNKSAQANNPRCWLDDQTHFDYLVTLIDFHDGSINKRSDNISGKNYPCILISPDV